MESNGRCTWGVSAPWGGDTYEEGTPYQFMETEEVWTGVQAVCIGESVGFSSAGVGEALATSSGTLYGEARRFDLG